MVSMCYPLIILISYCVHKLKETSSNLDINISLSTQNNSVSMAVSLLSNEGCVTLELLGGCYILHTDT